MGTLDKRIAALEQRYQAQPVVTSRLYEKLAAMSRNLRANLSEQELAELRAAEPPLDEVMQRFRETFKSAKP